MQPGKCVLVSLVSGIKQLKLQVFWEVLDLQTKLGVVADGQTPFLPLLAVRWALFLSPEFSAIQK